MDWYEGQYTRNIPRPADSQVPSQAPDGRVGGQSLGQQGPLKGPPRGRWNMLLWAALSHKKLTELAKKCGFKLIWSWREWGYNQIKLGISPINAYTSWWFDQCFTYKSAGFIHFHCLGSNRMFQSSDSRNTSVKTLEGVFVTQSAKRADKNVEKPLFVVEFPSVQVCSTPVQPFTPG